MRKVQVVLQDDIDGGEPAQTVCFSLDGKTYEIDLTEQNAAELRDSLAPWIAAGRRASQRRYPPLDPSRAAQTDTVDIRRWAKENHIPVSDRGRISVDLHTRSRPRTDTTFNHTTTWRCRSRRGSSRPTNSLRCRASRTHQVVSAPTDEAGRGQGPDASQMGIRYSVRCAAAASISCSTHVESRVPSTSSPAFSPDPVLLALR